MTELYLYQTIHLHAGRPRLVGEHVALLDKASRTLFGRPYTPDVRQTEKRIVELARAERYPHTVSGFVRLELTAEGAERLLPAGVSLYEGYALRSILPDAVTLSYELPLTGAPTSAREAAELLARRTAELQGAAVAVRCNTAGFPLTADDAPLFGVYKDTVFTLPAGDDGPAWRSVERDLAIRAAHAAGLEVCEQPFTREALSSFEELFYADHRGVTALAHLDGAPLMSLVAERVAKAMEALFSKK